MNDVFVESPNRILISSFLQKQTLIGGFFNSDKKYLLKEFFILSLFVVCALGINAIIIWPLALAGVFIVVFYLIFEQILKAKWQCF